MHPPGVLYPSFFPERPAAMRRILVSLLGSVALLSTLSTFSSVRAADTAKKIHVLLITGDDVASHNWREVAPATCEVLAKAGRFDVRVSEDPQILDSAVALKPYDVIFLAFYNKNLPK